MARSFQLLLFLLLGICLLHGSRQSSKPSEFALECGAGGYDCEEPLAAGAIVASPPDSTVHMLENKRITPKDILIETTAVRAEPDGISFEVPEGARPGDHTTFKVNGDLLVYEYTHRDKVGQTVRLPVVKKLANDGKKRFTVRGEEPRQAAVSIAVEAAVPNMDRAEHSRQAKLGLMRKNLISLKKWVPVSLPDGGMIDRSKWWISGNDDGDMRVAHGITLEDARRTSPTICRLSSTTPIPHPLPLFTFKGDPSIPGLYAGGPNQEDIWRYAGEYQGKERSADMLSDSMVEVPDPEGSSLYKMNFEGSMDFNEVSGYPTYVDYD